MKRILYILSVALFGFVDGMDVPVAIYNDTERSVIVRDFDLKRSSVDIWPTVRKVGEHSSLKFSIIPVSGTDKESFNIKIDGNTIKIWWNWVSGKGVGPFVDQSSGDYRVIKSLDPSGGVNLHILSKGHLIKEKAQELTQQHLDLQDLTEQTGYTAVELEEFSFKYSME